MGEPSEVIENIVAHNNARDLEVFERMEPIAKQGSEIYTLKKKQTLQARYVYGFIFFATNLLAWFIRDYGHNLLTVFHYIRACGDKGEDCLHAGGVLRVSLGCFIFFFLMSATTFRASKLYEVRNSLHSKWWILKFIIYITSMMVPFLIPTTSIHIYGEVARIGAGIFLFVQLVSVMHFLAWCDARWMPADSQTTQCGFLGLLLSTVSYSASFCGILLMYFKYSPNASCIFNIIFITWTAILVKVMMAVSLHSKVSRGLLSSGIMSTYIVFLCWSAIHSEPYTEQCKAQMNTAEHVNLFTILNFVIAICAIVSATFSTGLDSQFFQFYTQGGQLEDDIPYKYDFFHLIFSMGSMYFAMLFISWKLDHPTRKWNIDVGWASTWVKIINEWFAASMYLWKLIYPVITRERAADPEEPVDTPNPI